MFSLFSKKSGGELVLIFDIGSSSVGGAIAVLSKDSAPKLLYTVRLPMVWQEKPQPGQFLKSILQGIEHVATQIEQKGLQHLRFSKYKVGDIKKVYCVYSSPWYISQTKVLTIEKKEPIIVTHDLVKEMIKEQEKQFAEDLSKGAHSHIYQNTSVIERAIIRIKLNGYEVVDPYDKKASVIESTFFTSVVSKDILDSVEQVIHRHFNYRKVKSYSFPLAAFMAITGAKTDLQDFLIADVRGEVSDISLVKEGALLESISFPIGKSTIVRSIAQATNASAHTALSWLILDSHDKGTDELKKKLDPITFGFRKHWTNAFKSAIEEITRDVAVPKRVFLITDNESSLFFQKVLSELSTMYEVHPVKKDMLHKYIDMNSTFDDLFLAVETLFVNSARYHGFDNK